MLRLDRNLLCFTVSGPDTRRRADVTDQEKQKAEELISRLELSVGQIFPRDGGNAALLDDDDPDAERPAQSARPGQAALATREAVPRLATRPSRRTEPSDLEHRQHRLVIRRRDAVGVGRLVDRRAHQRQVRRGLRVEDVIDLVRAVRDAVAGGGAQRLRHLPRLVVGRLHVRDLRRRPDRRSSRRR